MPTGHFINDQEVHELLYQRADRHKRFRFDHTRLAEDLGVNRWTISRMVKRFVEDGRIRQITNSKYRGGVFIIEDPTGFRKD